MDSASCLPLQCPWGGQLPEDSGHCAPKDAKKKKAGLVVRDSRDRERVLPWEGEIRRNRVRLGSGGSEGGVLASRQRCAVSVSLSCFLQGVL